LNNIFGIGVDLVDVNKFIKKPYSENSSFYNKLFLPNEIKYCLKFKNPDQHFAGKFAVKESIKKSISSKIKFHEIETFHKNSKPMVSLKGKYSEKFSIKVSITHEKNLAMAFVIVEKI
jgi:holo-[acyl-carrier protein] synthase|tara:strand:+ start:365 stop:718 length:354 start_codon:yes stop_codon:yes gene_type:complete